MINHVLYIFSIGSGIFVSIRDVWLLDEAVANRS